MSLFGTLQISSNALQANQIGLQVVGNNIANASTPGYTRQEVVYTPAQTQLFGTLPVGLGVQVQGIIQQADQFINERLRGAISDVEYTESQKQSYLELEAILGELTETDLSTSLNNFYSSINDVLNQPEDLATRNLAALQGQQLAQEITRYDGRVRQIRREVDANVVAAANDINRLTSEIAELNVQIVSIESGSAGSSEAGGLRDQRSMALAELAKIIHIRAVEQESGAMTVFANGDYLVFDGTSRPVTVAYSEDRGLTIASINIVDSDSALETSGGRLAGLYAARDQVLGGFLDSLDDFTKKLVFEFNKRYSSGQGLTGFTSIESEFFVTDPDESLDQAGLEFTPVNGSLQVLVKNNRTGLTTTTDIRVDLNGLGDDTTLQELAEQMDSISGLSASVDAEGKLAIQSDSSALEFAFANDTSGVLAALGINTFFTGSTSTLVGVNETVLRDSTKFAASREGIGADSDNAIVLAGLASESLESTGGLTLTEYYERFAAEIFQSSSVVQGINDGFRTFQATLEGQQLGISGVNIDEQAVKMIQYQRAFQASARLISTVNDLLEVLVNL